MVLGTAQLGMDYGIANINGKPTKKVKPLVNKDSIAKKEKVWIKEKYYDSK